MRLRGGVAYCSGVRTRAEDSPTRVRVVGYFRRGCKRPEDGLRRDPGPVLVHAGDHVHIDLLCEGCGGVPESLADDLDRHPRTTAAVA